MKKRSSLPPFKVNAFPRIAEAETPIKQFSKNTNEILYNNYNR